MKTIAQTLAVGLCLLGSAAQAHDGALGASRGFTLIHDWYPLACCSENDCRPVPCDQLIETKEGMDYKTPLGAMVHFKANKIHPSQDKYCHVCYPNYDQNGIMDIQGYCVFQQYGN